MQAPPRDFDTAEQHFRKLTDRQRDVLRLAARGHTNPEIADALGITLDGAKWHVSELLGKLGLDRREDLADFAQWRRRPSHRLGRAVRALAALPALKVAGGVVAIAVVAGIGTGAWALFSGASGDADQQQATSGLSSFVLKAKFSTDTTEQGVPDEIDPRVHHTKGELEWWFRSADDWKWKVTSNEGQLDARTTIEGATDGTATGYDGASNTYWHSKMQALPGSIVPPSFGAFIGPAGWFAKTPDALVQALETSGNSPRQAAITGDDTVLGRHTVVIETPGSYSSSSQQPGVETPDGTMRIWLDPERMVVMKTENESAGQHFIIYVTDLEWGAKVSDSDLAFHPPDGAKLVDDPSGWSEYSPGGEHSVGSGSPGGSSGLQAPAPFFEPTYTPPGLRLQRAGQESTAGSAPVLFTANYASSDDPTVSLQLQESLREGGLPDSMKTGTPTKVGTSDGWLATNGDQRSLAWEQDHVAFVLTANGVSVGELMKMATSMQPGEGTGIGMGAAPSPVGSVTASTR